MTLTHANLLSAVVLVFLFAILAAFVVLLPRLLKKKEQQQARRTEADIISESFQMLGDELKSLKEQLIMKERLATLGEISAGIAHEFRNPMGVIMGYAKLILKSLDEEDSRREVVQSIIREIDGMNRVMDELLKFSKSEPLNKTEVDLARMVGEATRESVRPEDTVFESQGIFVINGDETLLKQAVKNLLNNALYAGQKARVDLKNVQLSGKKGVSIEVSDTGRGMAPGDLKKVFFPFYSTKPDGLGIGLSLVQKIAMAHGGSVDASSIEGKGSTFRIFVPY
ncbi:MAG: two-component system sensor histidine kinase NtrB [Dissulfurispiraceae bacterium]|jgi:two-component system, NtrC family, sensor histidine kinase HydH